jgi:hypothetical protein
MSDDIFFFSSSFSFFLFFFIRDGILVLYVYLQMAGPHTLDIQSVELVLDHSKR